SNRLTYLVFNDLKLKLSTLTQGLSAFVDGNYRGKYQRSQEVFRQILKICQNKFHFYLTHVNM
ncbi:hypothetical protein, partial [Sulfuricurvum sp.]|uniref:hypothetical protein n=1 Tax=Sulfuricurvum sp. TaxID=2025608 RepID=UPI002632D30F